jgi:DNA repair protein RadC
MANAPGLIVSHNHPSGDPEPSPDDKAFTARLAQAATILGLELLDHIVIGHGRYVSFKEAGLMA